MASIKHISALLHKDLKSEFRQKSTWNGIILYVVSTVFIAYLIFNQIDDLSTWVALFWIVLIFASTNASINTFKNETGRQFYYYYSLCSPQALIISKLIYNAILLFVIGLVNLLFFTLLLGNPIENMSIFFWILFFGSTGISGILTLVSAIASKTNNNSTLTAILAFPILLPMILTSIKASMLCGVGFGWDECQLYVAMLGLINVVIILLSYILFPYLWRS
ncbi:MAG: ABC transporter permease [Bacteroidetes bacterium]|nr:MAG: ABC transporter permease [Bacteroidota bacterium]MBL1144737.1 ABC transporter permease [Bacteroidota bacterium]NOG57531.1 ABC transporter permease [Bacteroidota bacterium]